MRGSAIGIAVVLAAVALVLGYRQLVAEADRLGQGSGAPVAVPLPIAGGGPSQSASPSTGAAAGTRVPIVPVMPPAAADANVPPGTRIVNPGAWESGLYPAPAPSPAVPPELPDPQRGEQRRDAAAEQAEIANSMAQSREAFETLRATAAPAKK